MLGKIRYDFSNVACFRDDPSGEKNRCSKKNTCLLLSPQIIILKIIKSIHGRKQIPSKGSSTLIRTSRRETITKRELNRFSGRGRHKTPNYSRHELFSLQISQLSSGEEGRGRR